MNNDLIDSNPKCASIETNKVKIIFEFTVLTPKLTFYRGVKAVDGCYRMEKRGAAAKAFRSVMVCGSEEVLHKYRMAVESYFRKSILTTKTQAMMSLI